MESYNCSEKYQKTSEQRINLGSSVWWCQEEGQVEYNLYWSFAIIVINYHSRGALPSSLKLLKTVYLGRFVLQR
jgi:hypothetical protein